MFRGINLRKIAEQMGGSSGAEVKGTCTEAGEQNKIINKQTNRQKTNRQTVIQLGKIWRLFIPSKLFNSSFLIDQAIA